MAPKPNRAHMAFAPKAAAAATLLAFFLALSWDTIRAPFAADEMMAIYWYWHPSPWRLLVSQFMLWVGYVRPLGALFYLPPFLVYGLDPVPYHVLLLAFLLLGAWTMWRLARAFDLSPLSAFFVALVACYHGGLGNLYFNSVFIFDVLCGIFYFTALAGYVRIRRAGDLPAGRHLAAFAALYLCALNSKEMAITMPAVLLAYEWLFHGRPPFAPRPLLKWLRGPGAAIAVSTFLNLLSIWGKIFGRFGLMKSAAYRPVYSWERFVDFQQRYIGDIFYHLPRFQSAMTCVLWIAVTYYCWRRRDPLLRFCWWYIVITPLPMEFLIGRDQACLYVCLAGWAIIAAEIFTGLLPAVTRVLAAEPVFRWIPARYIRGGLVATAVAGYAAFAWDYKNTVIAPAIPVLDPMTNAVVDQFRAVKPRVARGATVVFLDDPFNGFDMMFIAELWFRDRQTKVLLNSKTPLTPEKLAAADAVFTWRDNQLVRVR